MCVISTLWKDRLTGNARCRMCACETSKLLVPQNQLPVDSRARNERLDKKQRDKLTPREHTCLTANVAYMSWSCAMSEKATF